MRRKKEKEETSDKILYTFCYTKSYRTHFRIFQTSQKTIAQLLISQPTEEKKRIKIGTQSTVYFLRTFSILYLFYHGNIFLCLLVTTMCVQREEQGNEKDGGGQRRVRNRVRGKGRGRSQYHHNHNNNNHGNHVGTPPSSSSISMEQAGTVKQPPPGPRMPDGTRGFAVGRGKPLTVNTA